MFLSVLFKQALAWLIFFFMCSVGGTACSDTSKEKIKSPKVLLAEVKDIQKKCSINNLELSFYGKCHNDLTRIKLYTFNLILTGRASKDNYESVMSYIDIVEVELEAITSNRLNNKN
ncbi:hypothetical protein [Psychrobium sp. 1_MG-2023]|uniref:hypothetical protein n=1 Tax=Psychrobium sp. 1_MG-2023 TaxID=3062624 RepID=UPI000C32A3DB|nr:hypothetical protein [Psychrobium sp. 1_MG-2023]MDP2562649.1 hypothetical protein [Psychrobium sp. 1_MG-2023]PKF53821.1 hypothetical protein CW748_17625 [Alteromonadales bacterium alter-6D02]